MQQQKMLRKCGRFRTLGLFLTMLFAAIFVSLAAIAISPELACAADNSDYQDKAAHLTAVRNKADEYLATTAAQIRRQMYEPALVTLSQCIDLGEGLSKSQQKLLAKYQQDASRGQAAWQQADSAMAAGELHFQAEDFTLAQAQYKKAYDLRKYLPAPRVRKIKYHLKQVKSGRRRFKAQMKTLFKESLKQYRNGELELARVGLETIRDSGVELGFFDRGYDFTSTQGYLEKIAKKLPAELTTEPIIAEIPENSPLPPTSSLPPAPPVVTVDSPDPPPIPAVDEVEIVQPSSTAAALTEKELIAAIMDPPETSPKEPALTPRAASANTPKPFAVTVAPSTKKPKTGFSFWPFGKKKSETPSPESIEAANQLLAQGQLEMQNLNFALAKQYFANALEILPDFQAAKLAFATAQYNLMYPQVKRKPKEISILDRARARERVQRQAIEASFIAARNKCNRLLAEKKFIEARTEINQLSASADAAKQLLGSELYQRIKEESRALFRLIDQQQAEHEEVTLKLQIAKAQDAELVRQRKSEAALQKKIDGLFARAIEFGEARDFQSALTTLEQLLTLDPKHTQALWMTETAEYSLMLSEQEKTKRRAEYEEAKIFKQVREASIPWSDTMTFGDPQRWLATRERRATKEQEYSGSVEKRATLRDLDTMTISLNYLESEFGQILNDIQEQTGLKFLISWGNLELAEILSDDLITMQTPEVPISTALDYILAEVSVGKFDEIGYIVDDRGFININTVAVLGEDYKYYPKTYYIVDLTNTGGDRSFSGSGIGSSGSSGRGSRGSSGSSGRGSSGSTGRGSTGIGSTGSDGAYELIDMIQESVMPQSWEEGISSTTTGVQGYGTISLSGNYLVVRQTGQAHRRIKALLDNLRASLEELVSIEVRFLVINSNFFEDIGLDFDLFININNAGFDRVAGVGPLGQNNLVPRANPGPWNRTTPIIMTQDTFPWTAAGSTPVPGSIGGTSTVSGFTMQGSFLDNVQVDFLMRATQAHHRSKSLIAPHVTVINGEHVNITFDTQVTYVASFTAQVDDNATANAPTTATVGQGITLDITPTISANKRYVILDFSVSQNTIGAIQSFAFGGEVIQLPETTNNSLTTLVTVPDGGTLLLGGQKITAEVEKEAGVPALSKIPILNRIFSNRSLVKDESVLLILVKPTIILQSEEEEKIFGRL